jgi:quercetin dioxygenase-like cupin family protein
MTTAETTPKTLVLGPAESRTGEPLDVLGQPCLVKLVGEDTGNQSAVIHVTAPKMSGPPLHRHSREDEWFYVLKGEITVEVDGRRATLGVGSSAFAPRGTVHRFQNFHDEAAELLLVVTPAGFERFFTELSELNRGLAQPDFAGTERLMSDYGMELLGPPLS